MFLESLLDPWSGQARIVPKRIGRNALNQFFLNEILPLLEKQGFEKAPVGMGWYPGYNYYTYSYVRMQDNLLTTLDVDIYYPYFKIYMVVLRVVDSGSDWRRELFPMLMLDDESDFGKLVWQVVRNGAHKLLLTSDTESHPDKKLRRYRKNVLKYSLGKFRTQAQYDQRLALLKNLMLEDFSDITPFVEKWLAQYQLCTINFRNRTIEGYTPYKGKRHIITETLSQVLGEQGFTMLPGHFVRIHNPGECEADFYYFFRLREGMLDYIGAADPCDTRWEKEIFMFMQVIKVSPPPESIDELNFNPQRLARIRNSTNNQMLYPGYMRPEKESWWQRRFGPKFFRLDTVHSRKHEEHMEKLRNEIAAAFSDIEPTIDKWLATHEPDVWRIKPKRKQ